MLYYVDSVGLFGICFWGLVLSVDCFENVEFIYFYLYLVNENGYWIYENVFCVFEYNVNYFLWCYWVYGCFGVFYGGMVNFVFVVRIIMSVINYDYVFDYMFY